MKSKKKYNPKNRVGGVKIKQNYNITTTKNNVNFVAYMWHK